MLIRSNSTGRVIVKCVDTGEIAQTYQRYLSSLHWRCFKHCYTRHLLDIFGEFACEECGAADRHIVFHHDTYDTLGNETYDDVRALCSRCHSSFIPSRTAGKCPMKSREPKENISQVGSLVSVVFSGSVDDIAKLTGQTLEEVQRDQDNDVFKGFDLECVGWYVRAKHFEAKTRQRAGSITEG